MIKKYYMIKETITTSTTTIITNTTRTVFIQRLTLEGKEWFHQSHYIDSKVFSSVSHMYNLKNVQESAII
jgi:hypothetical protein